MALKNAAVELNGTNRHAKLTTNASLKNMSLFTWMAWIKVGPLSTSQYQRVYVERQGTGAGIRFACAAWKGKLRFEFSPQDGKGDTNYDYSYTWDNRWHHVAFVARISGATPSYEMYLDANQVAKGTLVVPSGVTAVSNTTPLGGSVYVGNYSLHTSGGDVFNAARYWNGKVSDILLFNDAKTQGDILTYFASNDIWDMGDTDMFSYWKLDENTGSTVNDADNGGWTGTLYVSNVANTGLWTPDRPFLGNGTSDTTVPATPTLPGTPTFNIGPDSFVADWNLTTDNVFVQGYELQVSTVSNFASYTSYILDDQDTSIITGKTVTGLLPGTNYYWRVRAFDAENNFSGYTAQQSLTTTGTGDLVAPLPPTSLVPSLITATSFRVSFTASASSDETGYKIDVATDPNFTNYLTSFRNKDIGNVLFADVTGASPLTTYYVRFRAYDAAENESVESTVLVLQTLTIPDITPPLPVEMLAATSVTADGFTMNWLEGVDDVGVAYYVLDVALDSGFVTPLLLNHVTYSAVNIGNVLSYRLEDLTREKTYYYRVRAVDGAGNVGANNPSPESVTTLASSIDEGGFIQITYNPTGDAYTNSASPTTNFGTANPLQVQGSGAAQTLAAHMQFNLSYLSGTIQSAMLRLYVQNASAGDIRVSVDNVTFDELTITHSNAPTVAGVNLGFTPITVGAYVEVDIGSLFIDGPTVYDVRVWTNSTDNFTFDSREGTNPPELVVEADPSTATQLEEHFHFHDHDGQVINYKTNPGFESNTTTGWQTSGAATIAVNGTDAVGGTKCVEVTSSAGLTGIQSNPFSFAAAVGQQWVAGLWLKHVSGTAGFRINLQEYIAGGIVAETTVNISAPPTGDWVRYDISRLLTNAGTTNVGVRVLSLNGACVFRMDNVMLTRQTGTHPPAYFDGDTSGAAWTGTVKASTSRMGMAELHADTTYIGDGDGDNSIIPYFKRSDQAQWIHVPSMLTDFVQNRGTKTGSSLIGPSYAQYNLITNPSFEINLNGWSLWNPNANAVFSQELGFADKGNNSAKVVYGTGSGSGITSNYTVAAVGEIYNARCRAFLPSGIKWGIVIRAVTSAGVFINQSAEVAGISSMIGEDEWVDLAATYTLPATTGRVDVFIVAYTTTAATVWIDSVYLSKGFHNNPYLDGDMPGGIWVGTPHFSTTGLILLPETSYDFRHAYTDPDGIVDNDNTLTVSVYDTHVTAAIADNVTTTGTLTLTPTTGSLLYEITYTGDDDNDNTVVVDYKRTDLSNYTAVQPTYNRAAKLITGEIPNLKPGTSYTVRATFADADGLFGTNPLTAVQTTSTDFATGESTSTIMFGGFVLMGRPDGKIGVSEHDAFGLPERRLQIENLPRVDGAIEISNLWGQRTISMTGFVEGDTRGELEDNKNALKRALAPKLQRLVIDTLSTQGRFYYATCESLAISETGGETIRHLVWDAEFACADPFSYDNMITVMPEFSALNNSTATANNLGDLKIDPTFKVRTTGTLPVTLTILNQTTGERLTPASTIVNGDRLVLDTNKLSVLKNGVEIDYAGGFPHLTPGSNILKFTVSAASGTPSILVEVSWRHRYL